MEAETSAPRPPRLLLDPQDTLSAAASTAFAYGLEALEREQAAAAAGEIEPIHQLRVASRRLRASIELFAGVLHAGQANLLRRDLPWMAQAAGEVRECDIIGEVIRTRATRLAPPIAESLAPIYESISAQRRDNLAKLADLMHSKRYAAMVARLRRLRMRKNGDGARLGPSAAAMLRPTVRAIARGGARLSEDAGPEVVHHLRVRIKRLRYMLEMLASLGGKRHRKAIRRLEQMQDLLGSYNDVIVTIARLIAYAKTDGAAPEAILAAGATAESLSRRERKLSRQSVKAWRRFSRSAIMRDAIDEIRRSGRQITAEIPAAPGMA